MELKLDLAAVRKTLESAKHDGIKAVAIVFMHAYRYSDHEKQVARLARDMGFAQVSVSHEVSPLIKLVAEAILRSWTLSVADFAPLVAQVDDNLDTRRSAARLMFMMSSGGLTAAELFHGKGLL